MHDSAFSDLGYYVPNGRSIRNENYEESKKRFDTQDMVVLQALRELNDTTLEPPKYVGRSEIFEHLNKTATAEQKNSRGNRMELTSVGRCLNTLAGRNEKMKAKDEKYVPVIVGKGWKATMGKSKEEVYGLRTVEEIAYDRKRRESGQEILFS
ncbi:MAG: hypothetical protein WCL06_00030 [Bacteroidota bacterium]